MAEILKRKNTSLSHDWATIGLIIDKLQYSIFISRQWDGNTDVTKILQQYWFSPIALKVTVMHWRYWSMW